MGIAWLSRMAVVWQVCRALQKMRVPKPDFAVSMARETTALDKGFFSSLESDFRIIRVGFVMIDRSAELWWLVALESAIDV